MQQYGLREVEKLLQLPRSTIQALIRAGFVKPARGPRGTWLFSFEDLVVLRTARALVAARVPRRGITRAVRELRRRAESGQYSLAFGADPAEVTPRAIERKSADLGAGAVEWFEKGAALERKDRAAAIQAYEKAVAADAAFLDAHLNLGALLHEAGDLARAERAYREALRACGDDSTLLYNLGVLLDDMGRKQAAVSAYQDALRSDPGLADGHYNLALLWQELGKPKDAIRHMAQYRRLTGRK